MSSEERKLLQKLCNGLPLKPMPPHDPKVRDDKVPHAPSKSHGLDPANKKLAIENALRYFPSELHDQLVQEFLHELETYGHIYMYRFVPKINMMSYPIDYYPAKCKQAAAIMLMIMNNLDPKVAQFPHELVTYGGNGQVFSNWAQFWLVFQYLAQMDEDQTLVMYSGHPLGLFPSHLDAPRVVITNGMMVPNYSKRDKYENFFALGVTMYGQMTAGSYCYIGPQGIVHGTTLTIMNAGRKYLNTNDLSGKVYISSGLGGMSGAQAKAAVICGCIGVIAEMSWDAVIKRYNQGWVNVICLTLDELIAIVKKYRKEKKAVSIAYYGNIVDIWERFVIEYERNGEFLCDLGSDQTSCHNPFQGGYYPVQMTLEKATELIQTNGPHFEKLVKESLRRQVTAINKLSSYGMYFWDYGNAFMLEAQRAGADISKEGDTSGLRFRYPSYFQDIMGDIFSLGFGPFRWVCTSGDSKDLEVSDEIAAEALNKIIDKGIPEIIKQQYDDNIKWIKEASQHDMVVGSKARILYADQEGRAAIALAFNKAISEGRISNAIVISRDHHDVSGTDSPFRETSNIYDGSAFCADMAIQNVIGDSFRGATWVAIHNGGGCGWGEVINGGFGLVLDGSKEAEKRAMSMLFWDVSNGVARRCWSGNHNAYDTIKRTMKTNDKLKITMPYSIEKNGTSSKVLNSIEKNGFEIPM